MIVPMSNGQHDYYPPVSPLRVGLGNRCPRCGEGRLFAGYLKIADRCRVCDLDLKPQDSGDGPAAFIILIVGIVVVGLAGWFEVRYEPPLWLHAVLWGPVTILGSLALLRPLKGVMIALQYRHRSGDRGDGGWR